MLKLLKDLKGDRQITEDDFYCSDEAAEFGIDNMFKFFEGGLTFEEMSQAWRLCQESFAFLDALIDIGEIVEVAA